MSQTTVTELVIRKPNITNAPLNTDTKIGGITTSPTINLDDLSGIYISFDHSCVKISSTSLNWNLTNWSHFYHKKITGITETKASTPKELHNISSTIHTQNTSTLTTAITRKNVEPSGIATKLNLPDSTVVDENIFWQITF